MILDSVLARVKLYQRVFKSVDATWLLPSIARRARPQAAPSVGAVVLRVQLNSSSEFLADQRILTVSPAATSVDNSDWVVPKTSSLVLIAGMSHPGYKVK